MNLGGMLLTLGLECRSLGVSNFKKAGVRLYRKIFLKECLNQIIELIMNSFVEISREPRLIRDWKVNKFNQ